MLAHAPLTRLVVLGVAQGRRMREMQQTAHAFPEIDLHICDYRCVLRDPNLLLAHLQTGCWLKIDSPGEDQAVQLALTQRGWELNRNHHTQRPPITPPAFGELMETDDWYAGFAEFLQKLERLIPCSMHIRWFNTVNSILLMTDKWQCQKHLQASHIPTPALLGQIQNYDDLRSLIAEHSPSHYQIFIKSRYSSSACGLVALRWSRQGQMRASSTAFFRQDRLFSQKRIQSYNNEADITRLINALAQYGAYVETWIPKPTLRHSSSSTSQKSFDFRCLALAGVPEHQIARASASPITNLHLDNERIMAHHVKHLVNLSLMHTLVQQAANSFQDASCIGFDIICTQQRAWVLEANAFGDLLPAVLHQGRSTYGAQLAYIADKEKNQCII